jgi:hypothetical protein
MIVSTGWSNPGKHEIPFQTGEILPDPVEVSARRGSVLLVATGFEGISTVLSSAFS